jgi:hypothetical protein
MAGRSSPPAMPRRLSSRRWIVHPVQVLAADAANWPPEPLATSSSGADATCSGCGPASSCQARRAPRRVSGRGRAQLRSRLGELRARWADGRDQGRGDRRRAPGTVGGRGRAPLWAGAGELLSAPTQASLGPEGGTRLGLAGSVAGPAADLAGRCGEVGGGRLGDFLFNFLDFLFDLWVLVHLGNFLLH